MIDVEGLRPYVVVYVTESVDGKIASRSGDSRISCRYDLIRLHRLRSECDAVMVGAGTVINDDPRLTVRYVSGRNPLRVVIDGRLRSPLDSKVFNTDEAPTVVFTSPKAPNDRVEYLRGKGVNVEVTKVLEGSDYLIDLREVLKVLRLKYGVGKLLVEGGAELLWWLFSSGLVDEVRVTISPYIIGGSEATSMVEGLGFGPKEEWVRLTLSDVVICECGNEVHLKYLVSKLPDNLRT